MSCLRPEKSLFPSSQELLGPLPNGRKSLVVVDSFYYGRVYNQTSTALGVDYFNYGWVAMQISMVLGAVQTQGRKPRRRAEVFRFIVTSLAAERGAHWL